RPSSTAGSAGTSSSKGPARAIRRAISAARSTSCSSCSRKVKVKRDHKRQATNKCNHEDTKTRSTHEEEHKRASSWFRVCSENREYDVYNRKISPGARWCCQRSQPRAGVRERGRPIGRGAVSRDKCFSASTRWGCSR